ncbi:3',5'-cyclic AMP phosphodiesterase CpdA [Chitinophaga sp. YR627]|uniref:metallophosphoesterase family protein n=1 Tax=Chitinophaga sp. YR627 TaxID=1881041 RepID=UPI0008E2D407|nr:metallophosphoesterase [Chitinophaga sp. YR627]SFM95293.1 3',5'-cyclic AMP phosphodiesterase CpdA [Chitinophaga sp. YR627]
MDRRSLLKNLGLGALIGAIPGSRILAANTSDIIKPKKRVLRFAHLTDVHLEPEMHAPEGLAKCLHHIQAQKDAPSFIMNTGDCIMDALKQPKDRVEVQWNLWHGLMKSDNSLPIEYCIGNHDCWGAGQTTDLLYGKKYALEMMHLEKPYRSFDRAGWHFIVLDSIQPKKDGVWYTCKLDDEQFDWLQKDLEANTRLPVAIFSHVPVVSAATVVVDNKFKEDVGYELGLGSMHTDSARLVALFDEHPNVKLCMSGHIHLYEQIQYNGVTYISNGAVSGNWWKGKRYRTDNGYAMVNLYEDGTFDNEYIPYGWTV